MTLINLVINPVINSAITTSTPGRDVGDGVGEAAVACDVCGHKASLHDRVAARYCEATQANALARGCICRP